MSTGIQFIIETLGMHYEYDEKGRILPARIDVHLADFPPIPGTKMPAASQPLFVLGRAKEGCVWRFSASLANDRVIAVARLAAREPGFLVQTVSASPQPERLVMIERLLVSDADAVDTRHEILMSGGIAIAELWIITRAVLELTGAADS